MRNYLTYLCEAIPKRIDRLVLSLERSFPSCSARAFFDGYRDKYVPSACGYTDFSDVTFEEFAQAIGLPSQKVLGHYERVYLNLCDAIALLLDELMRFIDWDMEEDAPIIVCEADQGELFAAHINRTHGRELITLHEAGRFRFASPFQDVVFIAVDTPARGSRYALRGEIAKYALAKARLTDMVISGSELDRADRAFKDAFKKLIKHINSLSIRYQCEILTNPLELQSLLPNGAELFAAETINAEALKWALMSALGIKLLKGNVPTVVSALIDYIRIQREFQRPAEGEYSDDVVVFIDEAEFVLVATHYLDMREYDAAYYVLPEYIQAQGRLEETAIAMLSKRRRYARRDTKNN